MEDQIIQHKNNLLKHTIYQEIKDKEELKLFMSTHVFAVWDFMSLAKRLQRSLTNVELPWMPPKDNKAARLINEIIFYEETDVDRHDKPASHLEMYLDAMDDIGADKTVFVNFMSALEGGQSLEKAFVVADVPEYIQKFVRLNIDTAINGEIEEAASSFLFGREDAIPDMFTNFLERWDIDEDTIPSLTYYLKRHIDLDGDEHGPAAQQLLERLIDGNEQSEQRAVNTAIVAITARMALWDGVLNDIETHRQALTLTPANNNQDDKGINGIFDRNVQKGADDDQESEDITPTSSDATNKREP